MIEGHRGITADSSLALAESLGTEPRFWLYLQINWDLWHAEKKHKKVKKFKIKKAA